MRARTRAVAAAGLASAMVAISAGSASAYESVNIDTTWGWGRGTIWRDSGDSIGFRLYLTDQALDGHCVYWQVQGYRNNAPDAMWERMTSDTCGSGTTRYYSGTKDIRWWGEMAFTGYRVKICRNINNAPDQCSEASRTATRSLGSPG